MGSAEEVAQAIFSSLEEIAHLSKDGYDPVLVEELVQYFLKHSPLLSELQRSPVGMVFSPQDVEAELQKVLAHFREEHNSDFLWADTLEKSLQAVKELVWVNRTQKRNLIESEFDPNSEFVKDALALAELIHNGQVLPIITVQLDAAGYDPEEPAELTQDGELNLNTYDFALTIILERLRKILDVALEREKNNELILSAIDRLDTTLHGIESSAWSSLDKEEDRPPKIEQDEVRLDDDDVYPFDVGD